MVVVVVVVVVVFWGVRLWVLGGVCVGDSPKPPPPCVSIMTARGVNMTMYVGKKLGFI